MSGDEESIKRLVPPVYHGLYMALLAETDRTKAFLDRVKDALEAYNLLTGQVPK